MSAAKKVLFVDDEEALLEIYVDEVSHYIPEVQVLTAENGVEALKVYDEHKPEIVFTDGKMPKMNGLELAKELSKKDHPPVVYMITGHFGQVLDDQDMTSTIKRVFDKPVSFDELISFIKNKIS